MIMISKKDALNSLQLCKFPDVYKVVYLDEAALGKKQLPEDDPIAAALGRLHAI